MDRLGAPEHVGAPARRASSLADDRLQHHRSRAGYLSVDNFVNLFQLHIEKMIVVVPMTFVIIAGEIDLSVASVMAGRLPCWRPCTSTACARAGDPGRAAGGRRRRPHPRMVRRPARVAVTRRHARRVDRLAGCRPACSSRIARSAASPSWFDRLGQDELVGPLPSRCSIFFVDLGRRLGHPAPLGGRAMCST